MGKRSQQIEIADGKRQEKNIIIYFRYEAKQYTISLPYKGSKHTPLLPRQRDFNQWIVVKYHSNITKVPFGRVLKTWDFGSLCFSSLWFLTLNKIYPAWMVRLLSCFKKLDKPFFLPILVNHPQHFTKTGIHHFRDLKLKA